MGVDLWERVTTIAARQHGLIGADDLDRLGVEQRRRESWVRRGVVERLDRRSEDRDREQEDYGSCCCAIQNLMLYLSAAGAASKWSTGPITKDQRFYELLGIDAGKEFIVGLIWYGYPKITPTQSRKDVERIVTERR